MSETLQNIFDAVQEKLGLTHHKLKRYHFFRDKNHFNETIYLLSMEWVSNEGPEAESVYNPEGTAVVDINFYTNAIRRIVFVNGVNTADHTLYPNSATKEDVIDWIEDMTGLTFGRQFLIAQEKGQKMTFRAAVDNIPVAPSGAIRTEFNDEDVLTLFSIDGEFPNEEQIEWEPFALTPDKYEPVAAKQCKLLRLPEQQTEQWVSMYGIEEIFMTNDATRTIPLAFGDDRSSFVEMDTLLAWDTPLEGTFEQKEIDFSPEVTLETVRANEPHPDTFPLTEDEITASQDEVLRFMRLVYPDESGTRRLTGLYLKDGYITAEIKPVQDDVSHGLDLKIKLLIERDTLTAVNYFDQNNLLEAFNHFAKAEEATVSREDAFDKLRGYLNVDPVYVYDSKRGHYIMCGKLDCDYGVNAMTGEVIKLSDMF